MQVTPDTPRNEITVKGLKVSVPAPYAEGHTLTPNEAAVLNQTLAENLRNNMSKSVNEAIEAAGSVEAVDVAAVQNAFDEYAAGYEFGVRRSGGGGRAAMSEEDRFKLNEVKKMVKAAITAAGGKISDHKASEITALAQQTLDSRDDIKEHVQARWEEEKERREAEKGLLGGLSLDLPAESPDEEAVE